MSPKRPIFALSISYLVPLTLGITMVIGFTRSSSAGQCYGIDYCWCDTNSCPACAGISCEAYERRVVKDLNGDG
jgi:hypothetical protein